MFYKIDEKANAYMTNLLSNIFIRNSSTYPERVIEPFRKEKALEKFPKRSRKVYSGNFQKL